MTVSVHFFMLEVPLKMLEITILRRVLMILTADSIPKILQSLLMAEFICDPGRNAAVHQIGSLLIIMK